MDQSLIRLTAFLSTLVVMTLWEYWWPRRTPSVEHTRRWFANIGILLMDSAIARVLLPGVVVATAGLAHERGWGLFGLWSGPAWREYIITIVVLDLVVYLQHILMHAVPLLWRLHRIHHADPMIDTTTGVRFHPLEILGSLLLKASAVAALGAPPLAVLAFEVTLNAAAMFNHANVRMGVAVDRVVRAMVVTPDMHRVHHSHHADEMNSNFGFNLSCWDRIFGTYRAQPRDGQLGMHIGLADVPSSSGASWLWMLGSPFRFRKRDP